jgi:hypothetical protein
MSNLLTIQDITNEALAIIHEESQLLKACERKYESRFAKSGAKIGASVDIRKPVKYDVTTGAALTEQESDESFVRLSVNQRKHVGMSFTTEDMTMKLQEFSKNFVRPAAERLAREIDLSIAGEIMTYGQRHARTLTNSVEFNDVTRMNAQLSKQLATKDRSIFLNSDDNADIVNANKGLFQSATEIAKQYEKGVMGIAGGFKFVETENVSSIAFSGTITAAAVNGAVAQGATSIALDGITGTATAIKKGQAFTVPGVYQVDPETLLPLAKLYTFIAAADATITAGAATVTLSVPVYSKGVGAFNADVNVSARPGNDAVVTFLEGAAAAGSVGSLLFGMAQGAVAFASVDLEQPAGAQAGRQAADGVSIRVVSDYDIQTDKQIHRLDVLYGVKVIRPEYLVSTVGKI